MPTPAQAIYASLIANEAVMAIVQGQIYPDQAEEGVTEPYLEYQIISDFQKKGLRGPVGTLRIRWQATGYCATRAQARALRDALKAAYDGTSGTFGGLVVAGSFCGTGDDDEGAVDSDEPPRPGEGSGLREVRMDVLWLIP